VASCAVGAASPITSASRPAVVGLLLSPAVDRAARAAITEVGWLLANTAALAGGGSWLLLRTAGRGIVAEVLAVRISLWRQGPVAGACAALRSLRAFLAGLAGGVQFILLTASAVRRCFVRARRSVAAFADEAYPVVASGGRYRRSGSSSSGGGSGHGRGSGAARSGGGTRNGGSSGSGGGGGSSWYSRLLACIQGGAAACRTLVCAVVGAPICCCGSTVLVLYWLLAACASLCSPRTCLDGLAGGAQFILLTASAVRRRFVGARRSVAAFAAACRAPVCAVVGGRPHLLLRVDRAGYFVGGGRRRGGAGAQRAAPPGGEVCGEGRERPGPHPSCPQAACCAHRGRHQICRSRPQAADQAAAGAADTGGSAAWSTVLSNITDCAFPLIYNNAPPHPISPKPPPFQLKTHSAAPNDSQPQPPTTALQRLRQALWPAASQQQHDEPPPPTTISVASCRIR
jgi:hypothetical protein